MSADIYVGGLLAVFGSTRLIVSVAGHVRYSCGSSKEVAPEERGGRA
jgi:hypothetical protein